MRKRSMESVGNGLRAVPPMPKGIGKNRPCLGRKTLRRPPVSIRTTVSQLPRHCEEGKARRGNPHPKRCEAPPVPPWGTEGKRIATAYGLAMTCVFWRDPLVWPGGRGNGTGDSKTKKGTARGPFPTILTYHAGPHEFYSTADKQNLRQFGSGHCPVTLQTLCSSPRWR